MIRTDLAIEAYEYLLETAEEISGASVSEDEKNDIKITTVTIETDEAEKALGKPKGRYVTIQMPDIATSVKEEYEKMCKVLSGEIKELLKLKKEDKVLVIGLGNRNITPDSLGPYVVDGLMITRHLFSYVPDALSENMRSVSAIAPGVLGITGMETGEIIKGICEKIKPDAVIAIDALASREITRINKTVQLCDTGISPGAGVGNRRKELSIKTLGVPVLALGVPTVIDAGTLARDIVYACINEIDKKNDQNADKLSEYFKDDGGDNIFSHLPQNMKNYIVTPKDIDAATMKASKVLANGINLALHSGLTLDDISAFVG